MKRLTSLAIAAALAAVVAAPATPGTSKVEGRWTTPRATVQQLIAAGFARKDAVALAQTRIPTLDFHDGVIKGLDMATGHVRAVGTYRLTGDVIRFVFKSGPALQLGVPYYLRWSVYRDRLTFRSVPGRPGVGLFTLTPWTRVR